MDFDELTNLDPFEFLKYLMSLGVILGQRECSNCPDYRPMKLFKKKNSPEQYCWRQLCILDLDKDNILMGGLNEIVEIDESVFNKAVKNRKENTLIPIIKKHVNPQTTIYSDQWKSYFNLTKENYHHLTVNHSKQFIDKRTGCSTNGIEEMYFTLKFGDNQEAFLNSNCKVLHLLDHIKKIANLNDKYSEPDMGLDLDVCDLNGEVKNLNENKLNYGSNLLREKEKYILIKIDHKKTDGKPVYSVLLNNDQIINEEFIARLNSLKKSKKSDQQAAIRSQNLPKQKASNHSVNEKGNGKSNHLNKRQLTASTTSLNDSDSMSNYKL
ncbi:unnamed protein product [Brachionus calyciflorus]|uniref:ISXO2-like transposase domain-containing protein n=1 Tax=Brachionus calyciflorus TaxID=104777 RepID=A0A813Y3U9_9BILA|nr:unnamed protein product [Brachionus calyciflorus]